MRIYISPENKGAPHGKYINRNIYERDICHEIADKLKPLLEHNGFEVVVAEKGSPMAERVSVANHSNVDYYLCIHTNAGGGTGTECLYYNHPFSIKANQMVYDELVKLYPSKRGLKDYSGFYENAHTKMVSCYPEIAFHDNEKDVVFILENLKPIALALCRGICNYYGLSCTEPQEAAEAPPSACTGELEAEIERLEDEVRVREQQTAELHAELSRAYSRMTAMQEMVKGFSERFMEV